MARREVGSCDPVRHVRDECPFRAACFRRDLPHVVGFPHLGVLRSIRLPNRIRWAFPVTVLLHLPGRVLPQCVGSSIVPCPGFPFCASGAVDHTLSFATARTSGASQVLRRLSSCMPRPEDSGGPAPPCHVGWARVAFGCVKSLGVRNKPFRSCTSTSGDAAPPAPTGCSSTLRPSCSPVSRLRHGRKTRYGWVANPYPTRTFTLQETPSFSWRDNARLQARLEAEAKRKL